MAKQPKTLKEILKDVEPGAGVLTLLTPPGVGRVASVEPEEFIGFKGYHTPLVRDLIIGVDPGAFGAAVVLNLDGYPVGIWPYQAGEDWLASEVAKIAPRVLKAVIERVGAAPGDGKVGAFTFGDNVGFWRGLFISHRTIPIERVSPQMWRAEIFRGYQRPARLDADTPEAKSKNYQDYRKRLKELSDKTASDMFLTRTSGSVKMDAFRGKDRNGIAEAFLIAEYGRLTHGAKSKHRRPRT